MKMFNQNWNQSGISRKFNLIFSLLFFLLLFVVATVYVSFLSIQNAEDDIRKSTEIKMQVLDMDRGMERAHRLLSDFFLNYPSIGLQKSHEQFAQPAIRQIAQVVLQSSSLEKDLFSSDLKSMSRISQTDVNLYLASAKRFAGTSIEAVELLSRRAAPIRGIDAELIVVARGFEEELQGFPHLEDMRKKICSFVRKYQIKRQRHLMQSAFNALDNLHKVIDQKTELGAEQKNRLFSLIHSCRILCQELLNVDREISAKFRDFTLQKQTVTPISNTLVEATGIEVEEAQKRIDKIYRRGSLFILAITFIVGVVIWSMAKLLNKTVTTNILSLTETAHEFGKGDMNIRANEKSHDELGQLAHIFNTMASQVQHLVENLEQKVVQRTAELSESEERFRHLVNDLPKIAVQGYDNERKVIYWNHASEILYGYSKQEAMGSKVEDLIIPEKMKEGVVEAIQNWYEKGTAIPASELILRNKDGSDVPIYASHVMLVSSQDVKTMYCVDIDLADLKFAQAMEQKSESFYRQLFDHSSSGVAVYEAVDNGQDFIFKDFNKAGEVIENVSRETLLGRKVTEAFPGIKEFGLLDIFRQVWQTGEPNNYPLSFYKDDTLMGWRENRVYKLPTGEIVAVYDDITDQKQLEEEKFAVETRLQRAQKMEAIGLMAGGVAHDLNNILSGITGYPELLLLKLSKESDLRQPIEAIKESGKRAAAVVADLLTVARGVAGTRVAANMNTLVTEYLDSPEWRELHSHNQPIQCDKRLAENLPNISCSPVHIKKCIMNLVTNAVEALDNTGSIILSTTTGIPDRLWAKKNGLKQKEYVILSVTDTGMGISKEDIDHIFEPFYTKKVLGRSGTGLGLAVVWNTMEDHAGKIFVESSGKGTCFRLYFPANEKKDDNQKENSTKEELTGNNEHILVVDDELQLRDIASQMLQVSGYMVDSVPSGELAITFLKETPVDLIVLDMLMEPGMNGYHTYKEILKLYPDQKAIVASGFSESEDVKATIQLGAGGFIKKPYSMEQLGRAVKVVLNS